ncbi:MAG: 23S rRNA (pseudouridine(1915)-N(3))-methyltransferase RlmH [Ardenticatenaceae bacterium]|nr:23S rRNA (pseudouridine(1915)-N(3))-methyltransferase RlmH [Ardenticatenaceae bacterium]
MPQPVGHIDLIAVGKVRSQAWLLAQADYEKRLGYYTRFNLVEVKDFVGRGQPDAVAVQKEGELLLKAAEGAGRIILLMPEGKHPTSPGLARYVRQQIEIYGRLAFLIGGPLGFSDQVIAAAHDHLSLSPLTFTHELARVILLEQLYRAFTILNNENYHK